MPHALIAKYGEARLPRYTSYPTAPSFSSKIGPRDYAEDLAALSLADPVSLYVHIPFCEAMCWYCGCHTSITRKEGPVRDYLILLGREIERVSEAAGGALPVSNIHFGGGTPTIISPADFAALMAKLRQSFALEARATIAVEIDPRKLTQEMIAALGENGVNRASLGVQSFDITVQRAINRVQSIEQTASAVSGLRATGIESINFDLIYGLPHQTVQSCIQTVEASVEMRPDRFSVFGYAHVPSFKKHQRLIEEAALPDAAHRNDQALAIAEALLAAGYVAIGLDHFALPTDQLAIAARTGGLRRNFQGYTEDPCETLIGLGASAIGRLPSGYVQNEVALGRYADQLLSGNLATAKGYRFTGEDTLRARIIERLMCDFEVDLGALCREAGFESVQLLDGNAALAELIDDGVVSLDGDRIVVSQDARFMIRAVAAAFDAYLGAFGRTHSKAA